MKIILLGPPGSGKGTQANFIKNLFKIPIISASKLLKKKSKNESILEKKIQTYIKSGKLVPDEIITKMILKKIKNNVTNGFILDGFPRTIKQADSIESANIEINYILEFVISEENILKRITGRRIHLASGRIYHKTFSPPIQYGKDDITQELLSKREDDNEIVTKKRIKEYEKYKLSILNFFKKNKKIKLVKINANNKINKISNFIKKVFIK
ncbi:nucleoside monophosphate kinase [Buchnera aphidicola (Kurisakia onigurumii)]|uniref:adenylate kinase family protein n=1 Tax=Buchnera aphidicola TaxID=9 RepID=UPI0031B72FCE